MREIKFRGKRVDNGEWVYGYYAKDINYDMNGSEYIDCIIDTTKGNSEGMWFEVIPETVGQYTGLKDKNGKGIFEGDIVSFSIFDHNGSDIQYKGVVKWENAMFEIWHDTESEYYGPDGGFVLAWVHCQDDEFEVIGSIYENPELLGEGNPEPLA